MNTFIFTMRNFISDMLFTLGITSGYGVKSLSSIEIIDDESNALKPEIKEWLFTNCNQNCFPYRYTIASPKNGWDNEVIRFSRKRDAAIFMIAFSGSLVSNTDVIQTSD